MWLIVPRFVGFTFKHWITPIKNSTKKNTRSTLGPWSDRIGTLAYALTPVCVALSTRESILSLVTGIPYQHFIFLHRWTGRVIYIHSALHTIGWTIVEAKLYQPQPSVYRDFIRQLYMVWGCIAMLFITFLFIFSFNSVVQRTGYEFFRKSHYIVAMLYIGACIGHWQQLWPYLIPALVLWFVDRAIRLLRIALIHIGSKDPVKRESQY
jgi:predicted ferric reductase